MKKKDVTGIKHPKFNQSTTLWREQWPSPFYDKNSNSRQSDLL